MSHSISAENITQWPESERPRERLSRLGAAALSDAELLAILLRSGIRKRPVLQLSRELLSAFHGLRGLLAADFQRLHEFHGLGLAKAATLAACGELLRRYLRAGLEQTDVIRDPEAVVAYLTGCLRDRGREVFKVLFLNKANRIIREEDLFSGTVDEAAVHPREIVQAALLCRATAVILVHNHPSGRVEPSAADRELTNRISQACETISVRVLDHIIIGDNRHFSFREQGLLG